MMLKSIICSALFCTILTLSGCAAMDQIGTSLYMANNIFEITDQELLEIEQKPLPKDFGIAFDLALINRANAAMFVSNTTTLYATKKLALERATQEETIIRIMDIVATSESFSGNLRKAGIEYDDIETRLLNKHGNPQGIYQTPAGRSFLHNYLIYSTRLMDKKLGDRLISSYFKPALNDQSLDPKERFLLMVGADNYRFIMQSASGDPTGAYAARIAAMKGYHAGPLQDISFGFIDSRWKGQERLFHALAGVEAINAGQPVQAIAHLNIIEKSDASPIVDMQVEELKRSIYWYLQDYDAALETLTEFKEQNSIWLNRIPTVTDIYLVAEAQLLISFERWNESLDVLYKITGQRGDLTSDLAIGLTTMSEAKLGRKPSKINEFIAMGEIYKDGKRGIQASTSYNGASTSIFWEMASRNGSAKDLERAIDSGRALGEDLRNNRYRTKNPTSAIPATVLGIAKRDFAKAAILGVQTQKADYNDLLNAVQILQMSESDRDITSMVLRLSDIHGVTPTKLRELQDVQRKVWATQNRILELSLASDTNDADKNQAWRESQTAIRTFNSLLSKISQTQPRINQILLSPEAIQVQDIQGELGAGEAFLAVTPLTDSTLILLIEKSVVKYHVADKGESHISDLVQRIRKSTTFGSSVTPPPFEMEASRELYEILLGWNEASIGNIRSLNVTTIGNLGSLPFSLLLRETNNSSSRDYASAAWLIKDMSISQIPSVNAWYGLSKSKSVGPNKGQGFIAWADPLYGIEAPFYSGLRGLVRIKPAKNKGANDISLVPLPVELGGFLSALPETLQEAESIATILGASPKVDVISGSLATRSDVMRRSKSGELAKKNVVMFATHGLAPGELPGLFQPALVMAEENDSDQLLVLEDILDLKLSSDWIILSACNTGSSDIKGGDPLSGLARGFFFAGARGLLLTHWSVETQSASLITTTTMQEFAKYPNKGHGSALRNTSLRLIEGKDTPKKWQHPAYWAPYTVVAAN